MFEKQTPVLQGASRHVVRGSIYAVVSLGLALYEALTHDPIRLGLIAGYGLVFLFGIFIIVTRNARQKSDRP